MIHKLLERQVKKLRRRSSDDNIPIDALLELISATYEEADTERRKKERSMKLMSDELLALNSRIKEESETYVSTIMENVVDGIATFDQDGAILSFNGQMQKIFSLPASEALGKNISILVPEEEGKFPNFRQVFEAKNQAPNTAEVTEIQAVDQKGRAFPIDLSISKMEGKEKDIYIAIVRDISERKEFQNELIKAKEAAVSAAIAKTNFLSTMSHEIRTPMNAVIGLTNVLLQDNPRPDQVENLEILKFSGENLLVLINDILDFNKIESGKIEFEKIDFSLKHVVNSLKEALNVKAKEKEIGLRILIDSSLPEVIKGDPVRLSQVLNNLVGNAIKFTEEGAVTVGIALDKVTEDEIFIDFEVKDTGIGIPEDKIEHIFESFTQSNSTITRKYGGTGLGLAITKRLLALQGSKILVESVPNEGSVFRFSLKFCKGEKNNLQEINHHAVNVLDESLEGGKVLLVEDNKINQMVAGKFLSKWGLQIDIAENGKIACEKVLAFDYDVVLMDLQMPVMDGYTATQLIREYEDPKYKKLPIIALTASAMKPIMSKVIEAGMNDFVSKPFNPEELNRKISKYIKDPANSVRV